MSSSKKTTRTSLTPENLEQAVGGSGSIEEEYKKNQYINDVIRPEMASIRVTMEQLSHGSEEYLAYRTKLESLHAEIESITGANQAGFILVNFIAEKKSNAAKAEHLTNSTIMGNIR
ncbi:MAG: hypothetical protein WCP79_08305 [Bacillota bacterium]